MQQDCLLNLARSSYTPILGQRLNDSRSQVSPMKQSEHQRLGQERIGSSGPQSLCVRRVNGIFEKARGLISYIGCVDDGVPR